MRIVVAATDPLVRAALESGLGATRDVDVVGSAGTGRELAELVGAGGVDAVVVDEGTTGALDGFDAGLAAVPVVALVDGAEAAVAALGAGARGVVRRDADLHRVPAAVEAALRGFVAVDEALAAGVLRPGRRGEPLAEPLTPRELEVLSLLAEGLSNKDIGQRLGISDHTAKFHVNAILAKLGAQGRTEAVVKAAQLGLVAL